MHILHQTEICLAEKQFNRKNAYLAKGAYSTGTQV